MRHRRHIFFLATFFAAACNDGDGGRTDADAMDTPIEDLAVEDGTGEDGGPEDLGQDDAAMDDPTPDEDGPPDMPSDETPSLCDPVPVACDEDLPGQTTVGLEDRLNGYSCTGLNESGGETAYAFTSPERMVVTFEITSSAGDFDLFLLGDGCDPASCLDYAFSTGTDEWLEFVAESGATYTIVADGYEGAAGTFDLGIRCEVAEICDDRADNNDDAIIDCFDDDCLGAALCTESACSDTRDNDHDSLADCDDPDCEEAAHCHESSCNDGTDNDGNGLTDCTDMDCFDSPDCATGAGLVGDPCVAHDDCSTGACMTEFDFGWPGGYCTVFSWTEDCYTLVCPSGTLCTTSGLLGPSWCLVDCSDGTPCRTGFQCGDVNGDGTPEACVTGCTDNAQCTVSGLCHTDTGFCDIVQEVCTGGVDDDRDGQTDCEDSDCAITPACIESTPLSGGEDCDTIVEIPMPPGERGRVILSGSTAGASDDLVPRCDYARTITADVVYTFTLTASAFVSIDLVGGPEPPALTDTIVSLRPGCEGTRDILCSDDWQGAYQHSRIFASIVPGTYTILVDGYNGAEGDYWLAVSFEDLP